ncbi:MAG TPA: 4Fe-4S dicluster domain-containing protein [bacterium]|nr:4Fe-4S dicluster domain-containing protein [bacterium]
MKIDLSQKKVKDAFVEKVQEISGQNLMACYQCGKCSAGCPAVGQMDILPNQIIRLAQLGLKDRLLESGAIWICESCMMCNTRCPKGIDIAEVIETLRLILLRKRIDHVQIENLTEEERSTVPAIALVSNFRKFTS